MATPKNHLVMVDSSIGKKINFTSENFIGRNAKPIVKHLGKGRKQTIPVSHQDVGSKLWIEEAKGRMLLIAVLEKYGNSFGTMDLMVMIAEVLKLDCCMVFAYDEKQKEPHLKEPYQWVVTEEEYQGRKGLFYTMSKEKILEILRPIVLEKFRFFDSEVVKIITKTDPIPDEIELVVNVASKEVAPGSKLVVIDPLDVEGNKKKFAAAQMILYSKYFQHDINMLPPNPDEAEAVLKIDADKKRYLMCYIQGKWEKRDMPN